MVVGGGSNEGLICAGPLSWDSPRRPSWEELDTFCAALSASLSRSRSLSLSFSFSFSLSLSSLAFCSASLLAFSMASSLFLASFDPARGMKYKSALEHEL